MKQIPCFFSVLSVSSVVSSPPTALLRSFASSLLRRSRPLCSSATCGRRPHRISSALAAIGFASLLAVCTSQAYANNGTWIANGTAEWSSQSSWQGGIIAGSNTGNNSTSTAFFTANLTQNIDVYSDSGRSIRDIVFDNGNSSFGYNVRPRASLLLTSGGAISSMGGTGSNENVVSSPMTIVGNNATYTFANESALSTRTLNISGTITGESTAGGTTTIVLGGNGTGTSVLNSIVLNGAGGGATAIVKEGAGTWRIGWKWPFDSALQRSSYTVNGGTLLLDSGGLGVAPAISLANVAGAQIDFGTGGADISYDFGSLSGGGVSGGGVSGGNIVNAGTYPIFIGYDNTSTTFGGRFIQGPVSGRGITKVGTGTLTLTGIGSDAGGTTILRGGGLQLDFSQANDISNILTSNRAISFNGGRLLVKGRSDFFNTQGFASAGVGAGHSGLHLDSNGASGLLVSLGAISRSAGGTLDITLPSGTQNATNGVRTTTTTSMNGVLATANSGGVAYATVGGNTWAALSAGNIIPFANYATGTANYTATNNVDVAHGDTIATGTVNTLRFNGSNTLTLSGTTTIGAGGVLVTSEASAGATISGGTLRPGTGNALVLINNGSLLTVNSVIANNASAAALTLSGTGGFRLNGNNTYTGATHINSGTVSLGSATALGASGTSAVFINDNPNAVLDLNGNNISIASLSGAGGSRSPGSASSGTAGGLVLMGSNSLTAGSDNSSTTYGGRISGSGTFTKAGTGTLTLSGLSPWVGFSGNIVVENGTLAVGTLSDTEQLGNATIYLGKIGGGTNNATLSVTHATSRPIVLAAGNSGTMTIIAAAYPATISGGISGEGNLRLLGQGITFFPHKIIGTINHTGNLTIIGSYYDSFSIEGGIGSNVRNVTINQGFNMHTLSMGGMIEATGTIENGPGTRWSTYINGVITNASRLVQNNNTSALVLNAANTFTGDTIIQSGTLTLGNNLALQNSGLDTSGDGVLGLAWGSTTPTLGGLIGVRNLSATNITGYGRITSLTLNPQSGKSYSYSGMIANGAANMRLIKSGTGTQVLGGNNTYTGGTTISAGTVAIENANALGTTGNISFTGGVLRFDAGGEGADYSARIKNSNSTIRLDTNGQSVAFAGAIDASNTAGLAKLGAGTLTLTGNNTYTGGTAISAGTLSLSGAGTLAATASLNATGSGATLDISALTGGGLTIGSLTGVAGSVITLGNKTLTVGNATSTTFAGTLSGAGGLIKQGTGTLALTGNNTHTGGTTISAGTLAFTGTGALAATGSLNATGSGATLDISALTGSGLTIGSLTGVAGSAITLGNKTLTVGDATSTTFAGTLTGAGGLIKQGTGTLTLTGNNTHTGTTTIQAGTLTLSGGSAIADTGSVVLANNAGATLSINSSETIGNLSGGGSSGGNITLGSNTLTVTQTASDTYAGAISGTGSFTKNGTGTLILAGNNTYTGGTTISVGSVAIQNANALGTSGNISFTGGALRFDAGGAGADYGARIKNSTSAIRLDTNGQSATFAGAIDASNTAGLAKLGGGTLTLSGNNTYTGGTTISAGTLLLSGTSALPASTSLTAENGSTLSFADAATRNSTIAGQISLSSAKLVFDLGPSGSDILSVASAASLSGTNTVSLNLLSGFSSIGNFTLLTAASGLNGGTWSLENNSLDGFLFSLTSTSNSLILASALNPNAAFWTGAGGDSWSATNFSTTRNGSATISGGNLTSGSDILFAASSAGNLTTTLVANYTVNSLSITTPEVAIKGPGTLTVNSLTAGISIASTGNTTIEANLAGAAFLRKTEFGTLTLAGNNTYTGGTTISAGTVAIQNANALGATGNISFTGGALRFDAGGAGADYGARIKNSTSAILLDTNGQSATFSGAIDASNTAGLVKLGNGTLTLSGANTYTGGTTISAGTLSLSGAGTLGATGSLNATGSGATLDISALTGSGFTIGSLTGVAGSAITLGNKTLTVGDATSTTFAGTLTGAGGLIKQGTGTLALTGNNTYTGGTTISNGTLTLSGLGALAATGSLNATGSGATLDISGLTGGGLTIGSLTGVAGSAITLGNKTLTFGDASSTTFAGTLSGAGGLIKQGNGTLTLTGNNTHTGGTTISAGTILLVNANALGTGPLNATGSGATLDISALTAGGFTIGSLSGVAGSAITLGNKTLTVGDATPTTFAGTLSGTGGLVKQGNGTLALGGNNAHTGGTTISAGTVAIENADALGTTGNISFTGGALRFEAGGAGADYGARIKNSTSAILLDTNGQSATFAGAIDASNTAGLVKLGNGTLTLFGANTYTGGTTISAGTLSLSGAGSLAATSSLTAAGATLDISGLTGGGLTIGSLTGVAGSAITLGNKTLTVGDATSTTFAGTLTGAGTLVKQGPGMLALGGNNAHTGGTTITAGTVALQNANALGTSGNISFTGGTLRFEAGGAGADYGARIKNSTSAIRLDTNGQSATFAGAIDASNTAGLVKLGGGTLTLSGANTYTGGTTISAGTLSLSGAGSLAATGALATGSGAALDISALTGSGFTIGSLSGVADSAITLGNKTLTVGDATSTTFHGTLTGSGGLVKQGNGTLTLFGANTYTGTTTISSGTLDVRRGNALGTSGNISFTGGSLMLSESHSNIDYAARIKNSTSAIQIFVVVGAPASYGAFDSSNTGGLFIQISHTSGEFTFTGNNTYTGDTTIVSGYLTPTLVIGSTGRLGGGNYSGNISLSNAPVKFNNSSDQILSGRISGTGSLTQNNTGTLTLSGNNTYTGNMTINAGTLALIGASALSANTTNLTAASGSTLNFADGTTRNSSITGNFSFSSANLVFDLGSGAADRLSVGGAASLSGINTVSLNFLPSFSSPGNFTLLTAASGLNSGSWSLLQTNLPDDYLFSLISTSTSLILFASTGNSAFWTGAGGDSWSATNFSTTRNGSATISGGNLTSGSDILFAASSAGNLTTTLVANYTVNSLSITTPEVAIKGPGTLTVNSLTAGISIASTGNTTIEANLAGAAFLRKTEFGTLTLAGNNTYTGGTTISAGTVAIQNANALGATGNISFTGGTLRFDAGGAGADYGARIKNSISAIRLDTNGQSATFAGAIDASNTAGLVKLGNGTLTLAGNNTYTGGTTISAGTVAIENANALGATGNISFTGGTLRFDAGGAGADYGARIKNSTSAIRLDTNGQSATFAGAIDASNTAGLVKLGAGTLALTGANTYTGTTTISAGTLVLSGNGRLGNGIYASNIINNGSFTVNGTNTLTLQGIISGSGNLTKQNSSTLILSGTNTYTGGTTISAGTVAIQNANALGTTGNISFTGGALRFEAGGAGADYGARIKNSTSAILLDTNGQSATFAGAIDASNTAGLVKQGTGTLILAGSNTYTGTTTIQAGTLTLSGGSSIADTGSVVLANNAGATLSINSSETIGNLSGGASSGGNIILGSNTLTVTQTASDTYAGAISGNGSFTKNGTGTLILSGTNTYTGTTTIQAGTLTLSGGSAIADTGSVVLANNAGATLSINSSETIGNLSGGGSSGGNITLGSNTLTVTQTASDTYAGAISGTGNFTKNGSGTLILAGNNTYTGTTTIQAGTLTLSGGSAIADTGAVVLANNAGATLSINSSETIGNLSGGGSSGGNITLGSNTLTVTQTASDTYAGAISGTGNFTKNGSGTLILAGNNTYTGTTTIQAGTLRLGASNILADSGNLTVTGGTFDIGTFNETVNVLTMTDGMLLGTTGVLTGQTYNITGGTVNAILGGGSLVIGNGTTFIANLGPGTSLTVNGSSAIASLTANLVASSVSVLNGGTINGAFNLDATGGVTANSGSIASNLIGSGGVTINGTGNTLTLSGNNTYTGATTISAGNLSISTVAALGATSGLSMANTTALIYTGAAGNLTRNISVASGTGTIRNTGSGLLTLSGSLSKNGTTLVLAGGNGGITVSGAITGSNANSDLVIDGGTTTLTGANSYNGPTSIINGGTLNANAASALPTLNGRSAISLDDTGSGNSTLDLGANQSVASLTGATSSTVALGTNTLTIGTANGTATYAGRITGNSNSALVKDGASTQVLSGNNTGFTGTTTVASGTLTANSTNALGGTSSINLNGGSLLVAAANAINDNADINLNGGRLAMSGNFNETVGALTLSANSTLDFSGYSGVLRFSGVTWVSNAILSIWNWSGTAAYGDQINDYNNPSRLVFTNNATIENNLANILFYSDSGQNLVSSGFSQGFTQSDFAPSTEIIAVPETKSILTALLLIAYAIYHFRRQAKRPPSEGQPPA